jgi:hypothetical protein
MALKRGSNLGSPCGGVSLMVKKISEEELIEWIKKSCEEQGKPIYIDEPSAISLVTTILRSA